jgi:hypothetical protein
MVIGTSCVAHHIRSRGQERRHACDPALGGGDLGTGVDVAMPKRKTPPKLGLLDGVSQLLTKLRFIQYCKFKRRLVQTGNSRFAFRVTRKGSPFGASFWPQAKEPSSAAALALLAATPLHFQAPR